MSALLDGPMDVSTPAVLLKLADDVLAHGPLGAARSLGRLGVAVHVLSPGRAHLLQASRYVAGGCDLPAALTDHERLERIIAYGRALPGRPVLLPTGDTAAIFVDEHAGALAPHYRLPAMPPGLPARLADKSELARLCASTGVPTPRTCTPSSLDEALAFASEVGYPLMVKSADPRGIHWDEGQASVARVDDSAGLLARIRGDDRLVPNVVLQQFIPGGTDSVWFFHGYLDASSTCLAGFVGQKLREWPPGAGLTVLGVVRENATVRATALDLLQRVGYRGIVDVEFRHDARTGEFLLLDLNPRLGANFRVFVTESGLDVVRAAYLDLTGATVPSEAAPEGRAWWVESQDPLAWRAYFGDGGLPWRRLPSSLLQVRELAWWAADDPRPFLAMLKNRAGEAAWRLRSSRRARTGATTAS